MSTEETDFRVAIVTAELAKSLFENIHLIGAEAHPVHLCFKEDFELDDTPPEGCTTRVDIQDVVYGDIDLSDMVEVKVWSLVDFIKTLSLLSQGLPYDMAVVVDEQVVVVYVLLSSDKLEHAKDDATWAAYVERASIAGKLIEDGAKDSGYTLPLSDPSVPKLRFGSMGLVCD
ncbi:MAG: hypothetical protein LBL84_03585 [Candidatus Nomurabacteria bacterium]|jgi:hypothetical protein|nr:hypothetical protein [Candidatus Nomurabacteria bacterium]